MLYHLFYGSLGDRVRWLRVFGYTSSRILAAAITALLLSFILGPWFIEKLKARQIGETIRADGPETHKKKAGTPTMGGSLILFCLAVSTLLWCDLRNQFVWLALTVTVAFGAIGFADDYIKVAKKNKKGLSGKIRLALEFAIAGAAMAYLFYSNTMSPELRLQFQLPFTDFRHVSLELPAWLYVIVGSVVVVGAANAVNFTDGLDGLAIGPSIMNAGTFLVFAYLAGTTATIVVKGQEQTIADYLHIAHINGVEELAVFCAALFGTGIGFLWYNTYPAQVFMGDVGALALGAALGAIAVVVRQEIVLFVMGGVFVLETVSVILQVASFKLTGKRIFRMAPIHHHFELKGWAEPKVIVRFWIITVVLVLAGLATLKVR
jgi:phospho-N-acetylmuramoyl-pentapeptide-transferase